jgi:multiple sugar transport system substrate-binding protein
VLTLWVPPQFSPESGSPAGKVLQEQLDSFSAKNQNIQIQVRIKAPSGQGGLLDSLAVTSAAAPQALPSLIALQRYDLEEAALKGLITPLDGLSVVTGGSDWFEYARQLSNVQGTSFGWPFAGDVLLLVYRQSTVKNPPEQWNEILQRGLPVVFPAADSQGMFILELYEMAGGTIVDSQGRPALQVDILTKVLQFLEDGQKRGVFQTWTVQLHSDPQAWQAYQEQKAAWIVTWSSNYLGELPVDSSAMPLPALDKDRLTIANGWLWALSEPDADKRSDSVRLAEELSSREFLAKWSQASGYLPPRPSALGDWQNQILRSLCQKLSDTAKIRPGNDLSASLGPALSRAAVEVLTNQSSPQDAAKAAADQVAAPQVK